jgi:hypothetical protein
MARQKCRSHRFFTPLLKSALRYRASGQNQLSSSHCRRSKMLIEAALFLSFVIVAGAIIVKAYEWRQDVLHGPYIKQNDWNK